MEKSPLISVIIPCYNHGLYVNEAIDSIIQCNRSDYEIIIIDDGSTDSFTIDRLSELESKGFTVLKQTNLGVAAARNKGISLSKGEYILPLDADNIITPKLLTDAVGLMEANPDIAVVYSDRKLFGEKRGVIRTGPFDLSKILYENYIDTCAVYRREVWLQNGGYDENIPAPGLEDWEFWISAASFGFKFTYLPEPLFYYRVRNNSLIHQLSGTKKREDIKRYVFKKYHTLYFDEYQKMSPRFYSYTWRIGSIITWMPRLFIRLWRNFKN